MKSFVLFIIILFVTQTSVFPKTKQDADEENKLIKLGYDYAAVGGIWAPTGNLSLVGAHPYLGFRLGVVKKKITIDFSANFKFINSPKSYNVLKDGILYSTRHFFGGYIGIDGDYVLLYKKQHKITFVGGLAYDGFDALTKPNNGVDKTINAFNLNIGLAYRFYRASDRYLEVQAKYNLVNYDNVGGTDLSGKSLTIGFLIGGLLVAHY